MGTALTGIAPTGTALMGTVLFGDPQLELTMEWAARSR